MQWVLIPTLKLRGHDDGNMDQVFEIRWDCWSRGHNKTVGGRRHFFNNRWLEQARQTWSSVYAVRIKIFENLYDRPVGFNDGDHVYQAPYPCVELGNNTPIAPRPIPVTPATCTCHSGHTRNPTNYTNYIPLQQMPHPPVTLYHTHHTCYTHHAWYIHHTYHTHLLHLAYYPPHNYENIEIRKLQLSALTVVLLVVPRHINI